MSVKCEHTALISVQTCISSGRCTEGPSWTDSYTALPCTLCADAESVLGFVLLTTCLQAGETTTLVLERDDTESAVNFQSLE